MKRHAHPQELLTFVQRFAQTLRYIDATAAMIRREYPGSVDEILPKLREIRREKKRAGVPY